MAALMDRILRRRQGFLITHETITVSQGGRWIELPTAEIQIVKVVNASRVIVRLYKGQRFVLNLFPFANSSAHEKILAALRHSARRNEQARIALKRVEPRM